MSAESQFQQMFAQLKNDPTAMRSFLKDPRAALQAKGIVPPNTFPDSEGDLSGNSLIIGLDYGTTYTGK